MGQEKGRETELHVELISQFLATSSKFLIDSDASNGSSQITGS